MNSKIFKANLIRIDSIYFSQLDLLRTGCVGAFDSDCNF